MYNLSIIILSSLFITASFERLFSISISSLSFRSFLSFTSDKDKIWSNFWSLSAKIRLKTTFIITTDHGRGTKPIDSWRGHGVDVKGSDQTWIIVFGKGVSPKGEVSKKGQLFNNQIAPLIRDLMGLTQQNGDDYGAPLIIK